MMKMKVRDKVSLVASCPKTGIYTHMAGYVLHADEANGSLVVEFIDRSGGRSTFMARLASEFKPYEEKKVSFWVSNTRIAVDRETSTPVSTLVATC